MKGNPTENYLLSGRCPLTYDRLTSNEKLYSSLGLQRMSRYLKHLEPLPLTSEIRQEARERSEKMSIGGVQVKTSAVLRAKEGRFEIVSFKGRYILKPQSPDWNELPENEDLTMRLAAAAGVQVPLHGLLYTRDNELCYFIERFDRKSPHKKVAVEDFGQILGVDRESKYRSSMESVAKAIEQYCSFPMIDKVKLFRRAVVGLLTGNEDMHLKNFSIITNEKNVIGLSPAYDMVNSTILLKDPDELALPLRRKKCKISREDLVDYFAYERLGLTERVVASVLDDVQKAIPIWDHLIERSFLSEEMRRKYQLLVVERRERLIW